MKDLDAEIVKNCTYRRREELENIRFLVLSQKRMDEGKINYQLFLEEYGAQFKTRSELEFTCLQKEIQNTAAKLQNKKFHQAPLELPPERKIERHGKGKGCLGFMKDAKNLE